MNSLTDEQRRRIEENKLKAMQRRAASKQSSSSSKPSSNDAPQSSVQIRPLANQSKFPFQSSSTNGNLKPNSTIRSFYSSKANNHNKTNKDASNTQQFLGKKTTGTFTLISIDRFDVDLPYNSQAIEVFHSIPSKQYDATSRKWSFHISDHDKLFTALGPLRPEVCVSPLPSFIHKALKIAASYGEPSKLDLSCLDESLIEAFMPFQREGVCFGVSRNGRVLIADDMGLGKTIQALGIASYFRSDWPLLIVAPSSVRYSWAESLERWMTSIDMDEVVVADTGKDDLMGQVLIISYDLMSKREKEIKALGYKTIILDESHMLKNVKSSRCKAASNIMKHCKRIIMLSGTPALSRPIELYTQISALDSKLFPRYQEFGIRYCAGKQLPWGWDYNGSSNTTELQILLEKTVMIRRLKPDVISQLPSKQRMTVHLDPMGITTGSKSLRQAMNNYDKSSNTEKQGALLALFNESAVAKHKAVCDYVQDIIEQGKKVLIFAHHKFMMDKLSEKCNEMKAFYIRIDGSVGSQERQNLVDHFQNVEETKVAILSITAANTGITLTAAQLVIFAELFWNPGALIQAEDRAHRIGQSDSVLVQYLVAKGTVDDYIWPLIQKKLNVLNKVGLSNVNFSEASSINQKTKDNGIMKYFSKNMADLEDEDLLAALDDADEASFKRPIEEEKSSSTENNCSPFKRKKKSSSKN